MRQGNHRSDRHWQVRAEPDGDPVFGRHTSSSINPFIRGIGLQDHLITTDPGVAVYVDGVYLGRQVGQNWNLSNIERVEVLRGPQGTLYGRNSIGGAINIITRQPGDESGGRITVEAGIARPPGARTSTEPMHSERAVCGSLHRRLHAARRPRRIPSTMLDCPRDVGELDEIERSRGRPRWDADRGFLDACSRLRQGRRRRRTAALLHLDRRGAERPPLLTPARVTRIPRATRTTTTPASSTQTQVSNEAEGVAVTADWTVTDHLDGEAPGQRPPLRVRERPRRRRLPRQLPVLPRDGGFADQTAAELQLNGEYGRFDFVAGLYWFDEEGDERPADQRSSSVSRAPSPSARTSTARRSTPTSATASPSAPGSPAVCAIRRTTSTPSSTSTTA